ncbi:hypothetical protein [Thiolapillus sp.]|uniref:hypothetical protein n=1 Tax=Thiolapillus sp. TaxID=2017437 RepID=UPI00263A9051|nr:hypothetical protein [Thiolapillus sp.]
MTHIKQMRGYMLAGTLVALAIAAAAAVVVMRINAQREKQTLLDTMVQLQADQASRFYRAVEQYVKDNSAGWPVDTPQTIQASDLIADGLLPTGWSARTPFHSFLEARGERATIGTSVEKVFVVYEQSPQGVVELYDSLGIGRTGTEKAAIKRKIAMAYQDKKILGAVVPANTDTANGVGESYTKVLTGLLAVATADQVVAMHGFPDLAEYEPQPPGGGGGSGNGIGENGTHGETSWTSPGYYTYTVPDEVGYYKLQIRGGRGGDGDNHGSHGSGGGTATGGFPVSSGYTVHILVGANGGTPCRFHCAGSGGGRTAVWVTADDGTSQVIAVVGGGAGGCAHAYSGGFVASCTGNNDVVYEQERTGEGCPDYWRYHGRARVLGGGGQPGQPGADGQQESPVSCTPGFFSYSAVRSGEGGGLDITSVSGGAVGGRGVDMVGQGFYSPTYGGGGGGSKNAVRSGSCVEQTSRGVYGGGGGGWEGGASGAGGTAYCPGIEPDAQPLGENVGGAFVKLLW